MNRLPQSQVFHGYGLSRKFFQATALTSWTLLADSMTAFTIGLSAIFVQGLGKNFNKSAFWTLFWDYPFGKRMQDHVWLSQLKNSSRLPSWLWQAMYNFQKSAQSSIEIFTSALSFEMIFLFFFFFCCKRKKNSWISHIKNKGSILLLIYHEQESAFSYFLLTIYATRWSPMSLWFMFYFIPHETIHS